MDVEFKALGQYVVAPPSKLMNADGSILHEYRFDIPLTSIQPLPASILEQLRKAGTSLDATTLAPNGRTLPLNGHTRNCIAKLATYESAPVGERDTVLWVLYWRMIVAGAKKPVARETVQRLNEKFASPCSGRELESFVFGAHHEYHLGCGGTVARLPWIEKECCPGCPENRRKTSLALKKLGLEEAIKARPVDTSLIAVLIWRAKLNARRGDVSVGALAKESGLAENTVRAAVERARAKGLWDE
jgi:lambda repressor-like predicted transcriptional regulator